MIIPDELVLLPALSYVEDLVSDKRILVFGPGAGYAANKLAPNAARVTVMDPSPVRIRYFRHRCSHINAHFEVRSLHDTQFPPESCDIIFGNLSPDFEDNLSAHLDELSRILHPEGLFVLVLPHERSLVARHRPAGNHIAWRHERHLKASFPHLERLAISLELCAFVGPDRHHAPTFQQDMIQADERTLIPIALCSKIPVLPEEHLMVRFPLHHLIEPVRRRLEAKQRRIDDLGRALDELPQSLPPAGSDDLAGVVLEPSPAIEQPDRTSDVPVDIAERDTTATRPPASDRVDEAPDAGAVADLHATQPHDMLDESREGRPSETSPLGLSKPPSGPPRPVKALDPPVPTERQSLEPRSTHSGTEEISQTLEASLNFEAEGLDEMEMPSPTEQPPASPAADEIPDTSPPPPDHDSTDFDASLDTPGDTSAIPPRRRRIEAAMAAPYEVLDKHTLPEPDHASTDGNDLPPLPAPADELRKAFLDQWDTPAVATEPETNDGLPEVTAAIMDDPRDKRRAEPPEAPRDLSPPPPDRTHDATTQRIFTSPDQRRNESHRGERALLRALRKEVLEKLPSVTRDDDP